MDLTNNTILVTGGGSGIGRGLAVALHRAGNRVVIAGRRREMLRAVAVAHPGIEYLQLDQSDGDSVESLGKRVEQNYPELNVLVNNAAVMAFEKVTAPEPGVTKAVIATNLLGPMLLTQRLLPTLSAHPSGAIINITSALGFVPRVDAPTYSATKAGLHSYTESLRIQLSDSGIQVIEIPPPRVNTDMPSPVNDSYTVDVEQFVAEVMTLLAECPGAAEVVVDAARAVRYAERNGDYARQLAAVNRIESQGELQ